MKEWLKNNGGLLVLALVVLVVGGVLFFKPAPTAGVDTSKLDGRLEALGEKLDRKGTAEPPKKEATTSAGPIYSIDKELLRMGLAKTAADVRAKKLEELGVRQLTLEEMDRLVDEAVKSLDGKGKQSMPKQP